MPLCDDASALATPAPLLRAIQPSTRIAEPFGATSTESSPFGPRQRTSSPPKCESPLARGAGQSETELCCQRPRTQESFASDSVAMSRLPERTRPCSTSKTVRCSPVSP